jgi:hypothetical protein
MATKKSTTTPDKSALQRAIRISDLINRKLTQLSGICALIGAADMKLETFNNDDLHAAMWGVQDLIGSIQDDYKAFYDVAHAGMTEAAHE